GKCAHLGALAAISLLGAAGCVATVEPRPVAVTYEPTVVDAATVPVDIYAYPRVYFGGSYVYLVNGRWYFPSARGWMAYRQEPRELSRRRVRIERTPRGFPPPPVYSFPRERPRERQRERMRR